MFSFLHSTRLETVMLELLCGFFSRITLSVCENLTCPLILEIFLALDLLDCEILTGFCKKFCHKLRGVQTLTTKGHKLLEFHFEHMILRMISSNSSQLMLHWLYLCLILAFPITRMCYI